MANNKKEFSDKDFICKKCRAHLALERFDRQCLVVGSLCFFNFARFACLNCEAINSWEAPNLLPTNEEKLIRRFPDKLSDVPHPDKRTINYLGVKGVSKAPGGKYKARIVVDGQTKYLGLYDSIGAASKAYEKAKSGSDFVT
jgi:ribosomal protein L40E